MDEWMVLTGGEAAYRQAAQREMRRGEQASDRIGIGRRLRTALAATLVALATRVAPAPIAPLPRSGEALAGVQG